MLISPRNLKDEAMVSNISAVKKVENFWKLQLGFKWKAF